jgi:hypothetical protein
LAISAAFVARYRSAASIPADGPGKAGGSAAGSAAAGLRASIAGVLKGAARRSSSAGGLHQIHHHRDSAVAPAATAAAALAPAPAPAPLIVHAHALPGGAAPTTAAAAAAPADAAPEGAAAPAAAASPAWVTGWWSQYAACLLRELLSVTRNPADVAGRTLTFAWVALLMGLLYFDMPSDASSLRGRLNLLFNGLVFFCLMPYVSMSLYTADKKFYIADASAKLYRAHAYYAAKVGAGLRLRTHTCALPRTAQGRRGR